MKTLYRLVSLVVSLGLTACSTIVDLARGGKTLKASDVIITEGREVGGFTGIDLRYVARLNIRQGDAESLTIRGPDNIVPHITTVVQNGVLIIDSDRRGLISGVTEANRLTFDITLRDLRSLAVAGIGEVDMPALSTTDLKVAMSGTGKIALGRLRAANVQLTVSGLGEVTLAGEVAALKATLSGMGNIQAADLRATTAEVAISGAGDATVWATDRLAARVSGAGNISYYGAPAVDAQTSGTGKVRGLGNK